jgi:UDPglucose 6-dehydrogenase/UDP-N-acetyl-D-galactosamine dehydrogenase
MPEYVAEMAKRETKGKNILIAGLTYKENVPDIRESPSKYLIKELKDYNLVGFDPLVDKIKEHFGIESVDELSKLKGIDCIIFTVIHDNFKKIGLGKFREIASKNPVLIDVRSGWDREQAIKLGFRYFTL